MRSFDVKIDASGVTDLAGQLSVAATVHLPDQISGPIAAIFGFPGGAYGRKYFDIQAIPGYSEAEHHTGAGIVFIACDHLGTGDSSKPDPLSFTYENLAAANDRAARSLLTLLKEGKLADGVAPVHIETAVGIGQSMGGCLLTVQQANHRTFDGVAFLGWSGVGIDFPRPDGSRFVFPVPPRGSNSEAMTTAMGAFHPDIEHYRFCFHWEDEEPSLVEDDLASYVPGSGLSRGDDKSPWGSATVPTCAITMMNAGVVAAEAAAIDVPVLIGSGERDLIPDPWQEPAAYRGSNDVSVIVVPRMGHMHNFARTREQLWRRISTFANGVAPRWT